MQKRSLLILLLSLILLLMLLLTDEAEINNSNLWDVRKNNNAMSGLQFRVPAYEVSPYISYI